MKDLRHMNPIVGLQLFEYPQSNDDLFEVIGSEAVIVRADYLDDHSGVEKLTLTNGVKIYALRSVKHGGQFNGSLEERHARLIQSISDYDIIELESVTDLVPELLAKIPPSKRLIRWYGRVGSFEEIEDAYLNIASIDASLYQVINEPLSISDGLWPLQLLKKYNAQNLIAYASGAMGVWSQILSAFKGSAMVYGNLNRTFEDQQYLTYEQLKEDYGLPGIREIKVVYGIAGNPVFTSMSPLIHNKSYEYLDLNALYLPFHIEEFDDFWHFISESFQHSGLNIELGGFTMVSPYKEASFKVAKGHLSAPTLTSKACNILVNKNGEWYSDSSDGLGVLSELEDLGVELDKLKIAIIGCGGAGRTIASCIKSKGAQIIFYNRSAKRGLFASKLLNLPFKSITDFNPAEYDIVVNATPVGKSGKSLIFDPSNLRECSIAIDMAYTKKDTLLVEGCRKHNKKIIEGKQILLHQVKKQFYGLTGLKMPYEVELMVRDKTENRLNIK